MKLQAILSAILLATVSVGIHAADADPAPAADTRSEQAPQKFKPHSHAQEKTGIPPAAYSGDKKAGAETGSAPQRKDIAKDKRRHFHPRDMK